MANFDIINLHKNNIENNNLVIGDSKSVNSAAYNPVQNATGVRNIKLTLKFDGTNYHGFQIQKNASTVQQSLMDAIFAVTGESVTIYGCGRTDALVHAFNYICNFKTHSKLACNTLMRALYAKIPEDIAVVNIEEAETSFNARYDVMEKTYEYHIWNAPHQNPFLLNYAYWIKTPLSIEKMQQAAKAFLGTHDFIGFANAGFTVKTTVRTITQLSVVRDCESIRITVTADGFLYNMVRIIAGTLIDVGRQKILPSDMADIIKSRDRKRAGATAKPYGLYLKDVVY